MFTEANVTALMNVDTGPFSVFVTNTYSSTQMSQIKLETVVTWIQQVMVRIVGHNILFYALKSIGESM